MDNRLSTIKSPWVVAASLLWFAVWPLAWRTMLVLGCIGFGYWLAQ